MSNKNSRAFRPGMTGKTIGRTGPEWRQDFLTSLFATTVGLAATALAKTTVKVAGKNQPAYEIVERETAHREFSARLMQRKGNGKLVQVAGPVRIGMFGKLLDKPAPAAAQTPAVQAEEAPAE